MPNVCEIKAHPFEYSNCTGMWPVHKLPNDQGVVAHMISGDNRENISEPCIYKCINTEMLMPFNKVKWMLLMTG